MVKDCELLESENLSLKEVTFQTPAGFGMKPACGDPFFFKVPGDKDVHLFSGPNQLVQGYLVSLVLFFYGNSCRTP